MNPYPLLALNHFTVPCSLTIFPLLYLHFPSYLMPLDCLRPRSKKAANVTCAPFGRAQRSLEGNKCSGIIPPLRSCHPAKFYWASGGLETRPYRVISEPWGLSAAAP